MANKAVCKEKLKLALCENNKRLLEYTNAADNKIRRQLNRSNFIFVDDYDPCNGIITEGLTYYIDFLDSYRSPDVSYVYNVINNEQYAQNNGVFINNKKGVFGSSQYLHAQDIKMQYPVTLEFLLQFDSSKNQIVFFENYSPRIICGYWSSYFNMIYKGGKTFAYDFSELTSKVNLLTICYESESVVSIYINGIKLEEQDKTDTWNSSSFTGTYIGRRSYNSTNHFQGNMYRVRIYDRILTEEEILANYSTDMEFINSSVEYGKQYNLNVLGYENKVIGIEDTPVGHIISHMGLNAPKHYLICDGTEYNILDYPQLANHILDEFGSYNYFGGDGESTFCVPDLRGEFLRGTGTATRDTGSGADVGIHQDATEHLAEYISATPRFGLRLTGKNELYSPNLSINYDKKVKDAEGYYSIDYTTNKTEDYGEEMAGTFTSRPTNTSVLYCIKYESTYFYADNVTVQYINTDEKLEQEIAQLGLILDDINGEVV